MTFTITYHWWMLPTLLSIIVLAWVFWPDRRPSGWFDIGGAIHGLFKGCIGLVIISLTWILTAIFK